MRSDHPLELLDLVSKLLTIGDPRQVDPFNPAESPSMSVAELMETFINIDLAETTAVLTATAAIVDDDVLRARIKRELATRRSHLPVWLTGLGDVAVYRALEMVHVLGDGDDVTLGVRLPSGHQLTAIVYIDHNLGTIVKDAFVVSEPIDGVIALMKDKCEDPAGTAWNDLDLASARTRIADAIDRAAIQYPPHETDDWPGCRPLVEWLIRTLPEGGKGYEFPQWDDVSLQVIADRFFASSFGSPLDDEQHRQLLDSLLWFGSRYGPADPLRWSPVSVEIVLVDWFPRKIVADAEFLSEMPRLLRAFIEFCHDERAIRRDLTLETLDAVDRWEPEYQELIRSERLQGVDAIFAAMGLSPQDEEVDDLDAESSYAERVLNKLIDDVGSMDALRSVDDTPLPDEEFDWAGIPDDVRREVAEVLALTDGGCEHLLEPEYRTACRRFLAYLARTAPTLFRQEARVDHSAAGVIWVVGKANDLFSPYGGALKVKTLKAYFARSAAPSQRGGVFLRALGLELEPYAATSLRSPSFLVSARRRYIVRQRDLYIGSA